jgi:HK97 family phage major capsid protein
MKIEDIKKKGLKVVADLRELGESLAAGKIGEDEYETRLAELQAEATLIEKSASVNKRAAELESSFAFETRQVGTAQVSQTEESTTVESEGLALSDKQFRAISTPEYRDAFTDYVRRGNNAASASFRTLQVGLDTNGGYLVPADYLNQIVTREPAPASVVDYVQQINTSSDRLQIPRSAYAGQTGDTNGDIYSSNLRIQWTAETQQATDVTPTFGIHEIPVWGAKVQVPITRQMMEDSAVDIMGYISNEIGTTYRLGTEDAILNGDGVNKPKGVLRSPGATYEPPTTNVGNPVTPQGLANLVYQGLPQQYAANSRVVMNRSLFATLAMITQNSNLVWDGVFTTAVSRAAGEALFGYPISFSSFMPAAGGGNNIIAYGDWFQSYLLVRRLGMSVEMDIRPAEEVGRIVARTRFGGDIRNPRALRIGVQS